MKKNKLALAIVSLMSLVTLAACSGGSEDIVTMKGSKITVDDFYNEIKSDQNVQGNLRNMIIFKVAEDGYGDKVDKKEIDKEFDKTKKQLGKDFKQQLEMSGYTEASYKEQLEKSMAFQEMLKSHIKIKDSDLKTIWSTYHPEVETQIIAVEEEAKAKELAEKAKNGDDFGKLAKENSTAPSSKENGTMKFDSTDMQLPDEVKTQAFKMKKDDVSEVVKATVSDGYQETEAFYIIKMVKPKDKGNDMKAYKKELTKIAEEQELSNQEFQQSVISKELKKANIKIKDDSMKSVLAGYIDEEPAKEDKKSDKKDTKKEDKKDDKKSDKK